MSTLEPRVAGLERRSQAHDQDIRGLYRELSWLRRAVTAILAHLGVDPPADEEE